MSKIGSTTMPRGKRSHRSMQALALEPRMMFDAAMVATAAAVERDAAADAPAVAEHADPVTDLLARLSSDSAPPAANAPRREVAFIDTSVADWQTLRDGIAPGIEVVLLDGGQDGLSQMAAWAQGKSGYDAIHVLSHGAEGRLQLGTLTLDAVTAGARAADLAALGAALTADGDLLLYGCEVAEGQGQQFISSIAELTHADVAASTDLTGARTLGGNWVLESETGVIDTDTPLLAVTEDRYAHSLNVTGTNAQIDVDGSLALGPVAVGSGEEFFLDGATDVNSSNWYIDIDPASSKITMTIRNNVEIWSQVQTFDLIFSGGILDKITSITKNNGQTTSSTTTTATVNGNDKTITFSGTLSEVANGVIVWDFTSTTTGGDITAPILDGANSSPADNATGVAVTSDLVIDFSENVQFGTSGTITVRNVTTNAVAGTFTINGDRTATGNSGFGTATISNDKLTINPTNNLLAGTQYSVQFTAGSIQDTATTPNDLAAITDDTTYNFTTAAPTVTLSGGTTVAESGGPVTITATLNAAASTDTVVTLTPTGTATGSGTDYTLSSTTITITAGQTTGTTTVTLNDDALDEAVETIVLDITGVSGGGGATENATQQQTINITDNDPLPSLSIANVSQAEGNSGTSTMTFTVTLSAVSGRTVDVNYATSDGTATAGSDYVMTNGTLSFAAGETSKTFTVTINGDTTVESDETFTVTLSGENNATIATAMATGTIQNDENTPPQRWRRRDGDGGRDGQCRFHPGRCKPPCRQYPPDPDDPDRSRWCDTDPGADPLHHGRHPVAGRWQRHCHRRIGHAIDPDRRFSRPALHADGRPGHRRQLHLCRGG
jgi:fibronectin-binding autotransporter adhesin